MGVGSPTQQAVRLLPENPEEVTGRPRAGTTASDQSLVQIIQSIRRFGYVLDAAT